MTRAAIAELKLILAILFAAAVVAQAVILPWMASEVVAVFPEVQSLRQPILVLSVLAVACIEVALICLWRLLTLAGQSRISGRPFLRCLDALVVALLAGAVLTGSILAVITEADQGTGGPIPPLALLTGTGGCTVAALAVLLKRRQLTVAAERKTRRA